MPPHPAPTIALCCVLCGMLAPVGGCRLGHDAYTYGYGQVTLRGDEGHLSERFAVTEPVFTGAVWRRPVGGDACPHGAIVVAGEALRFDEITPERLDALELPFRGHARDGQRTYTLRRHGQIVRFVFDTDGLHRAHYTQQAGELFDPDRDQGKVTFVTCEDGRFSLPITRRSLIEVLGEPERELVSRAFHGP